MIPFKRTIQAGLILLLASSQLLAQAPERWDASRIQLALKKLNTVGSVMYIAAHPDDENTRLLTYLANERLFRTVYVSLTRGDGGQNLIGEQQGEELGLIRTQELLAARRTDGAEQYFTSAIDFGYSKSPEETFEKWGKEQTLADLVWAIRLYRPDVIINRFPTTGEGGHGHHTASAILAVEAFKAAADPKRFPEQLKFVKPWQARRIFHNSFTPRGQPLPDMSGQIRLDVGGYNSLLGASYGEIASESRSMHKSQGFGVARGRGIQYEYFRKLDGDTSVSEILGGINPMWSRIDKSEEVQKWVNEAVDFYNPAHPEYTVPALVKVYKALEKLDDSYWKTVKQDDVLDLIKACLGLFVEAAAKEYALTPGIRVAIDASVISRSFDKWNLVSITLPGTDTVFNKTLRINDPIQWQSSIIVPANQPCSEPYWLNGPPTGNLYPGNREISGMPENAAPLTATFNFKIDNESISFSVPVVFKNTDPVKGEVYRPVEILPVVSVIVADPVMVFPDTGSKKIRITITTNQDSISGNLKLKLPQGWNSTPQSIAFSINNRQTESNYDFVLTAPVQKNGALARVDTALVTAEVNGNEYQAGIRRIDYDHIPSQFHLRESTIKLVQLDLITTARRIGYLEGAGDDVAECLAQAGFEVEQLDEAMILNGNLSRFDAIVTGIRAYNTNERIGKFQQSLMEYVKKGGTLVVQYNTSNFLGTVKSEMGPYPFKISRDRVTDELAVVTFLNKNHRLLKYPNSISKNDFEGWVQERGLYFATEQDSAYELLFAMNDKDEKPANGSLIVARYGTGTFIYTGIAFFRQLPAGVPGAYRIFTNLLNAGK